MKLYFLTVVYNQSVGRQPQQLVGTDCHTVKSVAGTVFHYADNVQEVTVKDTDGQLFLKLVKDQPEQNVNIPSAYAQIA